MKRNLTPSVEGRSQQHGNVGGRATSLQLARLLSARELHHPSRQPAYCALMLRLSDGNGMKLLA